MNPIPVKMLDDVCKIGQGNEQCRFLARQETKDIYLCLKTDSEKSSLISGEVSCFIRQFGNGPTEHDLPMGDNCKGYKFM